MSKLKKIREVQNLTQEELSEKSGISIRTIQRIEAGTEPKGQTLKILSKALGITETELLVKQELQNEMDFSFLKVINLSSLFFTIIPPANILLPLIFMFAKKQFNPLAKQVVSIQIIWSILAVIIFMLASFMKNWFLLGSKFILIVMILLVLSNVFVILRNAAEIDKNGRLFFYMSFNLL